jgi:hypothetical protein
MRSTIVCDLGGSAVRSPGGGEGAAMLAVGACDQGPLEGALAGAPPRHLMRHGARPVLICPRPQWLARKRFTREFPSMAS